MTDSKRYRLHVEAKDAFGNYKRAVYETFKITGKEYKLQADDFLKPLQ